MKRHISLLSIILAGAAASLVVAGEFNSRIITPTSDALALNVPDEHFVRIRTFTQSGGSQRGVVAVTVNGQTKNVLTAALIDQSSSVPLDPMKRVVIAGPAQVMVAPVPDATLFITYVRQANPPDRTPTPTPTPTPTATPTATVTPTPTPTATP